MRTPERVLRTADLLEVREGQHILEIGSGSGALTEVICTRLGTGRFAGCDRSSRAVAAAGLHHRDHVASGLARFHEVALAAIHPDRLGCFVAEPRRRGFSAD